MGVSFAHWNLTQEVHLLLFSKETEETIGVSRLVFNDDKKLVVWL